jgi:hypothetical protein
MRRLRALVLLVALSATAGHAEIRFVDSLVAEVAGAVVAASDVALARALGLFGLTPAAGALSAAEIERYADGLLLVGEAARIGVETTAAERAAAWEAVAARSGGEPALTAWLAAADVDLAWARRMVEDDLRLRRFVELRFRGLAFVGEAEVAAALGSAPHDEAEREATRARLEDEAVARRLAEWLAEARARGAVRGLTPEHRQVPDPLPGRPGANPSRQ